MQPLVSPTYLSPVTPWKLTPQMQERCPQSACHQICVAGIQKFRKSWPKMLRCYPAPSAPHSRATRRGYWSHNRAIYQPQHCLQQTPTQKLFRASPDLLLAFKPKYCSPPVHNAHIEQFGGSVYKIAQYLIPSHQRCLGINRVWDSRAYFELNSMDTEPPKIARYIALCRFWTKFENLECEIRENRIFSLFLRVVCTRKKICSNVHLFRFLATLVALHFTPVSKY